MLRLSFASAVIAALAIGADATSVAVIEFGKGGTLHRTTSTAPETTASGVLSFFRSLHEVDTGSNSRRSRSIQYPGMNVVPNMFSRPNGGVAISIRGESIDIAAMPTLAGLFEQDGAVGHINMKNSEGDALAKQLKAESVDSHSLEASITKKAEAVATEDGNRLESITVNVENAESAADIDAGLRKSLKAIAEQAKENGATIVVHILVDEADGAFNGRLAQRRRLEDGEDADDAAEEEEEEDNGDDGGNQNDQNENEEDEEKFDSSQFGYYKKNGQYYNPYRSMNDIQYTNVVLWTAIGLTVVLFTANMMMLNMKLMPDTLLFGESAKVGSD